MTDKKTKTIIKKADEEEIILGKSTESKTIEIVDCFNPQAVYEVTNLELKNEPTLVSGVTVKNYFGMYSKEPREALEAGASEVIIQDIKKTKNLYKIKAVKQ